MQESQSSGERNSIERWFGLAKQRYRLGNLMCRKPKHTIGEVFLVAMAVNIMGELATVLLYIFYMLRSVLQWIAYEDINIMSTQQKPQQTYQ